MLLKTSRTSPDRARREGLPAVARYATARLIGAAALLFWSIAAQAFDMNSDAPISVNADHARLDDNAGKATYTGNVVIVQAGTSLRADRVELYRDAQGLSRMLAFGDPAHYQQPETAENPATDARANQIEFEAARNLLIFREDAVIRQTGDVFRGDIIRYNTEERVVTADRGDSADSSQVEMIIQPRRDEPGSSSSSDQGDSNGAADRN